MSITYEEALETLQSMFGEPWNRDTLDTVLRYQKGHMENTVDMILRHGAADPDILIDQIENGTVDNNNTTSSAGNNRMTAIDEQLARQLSSSSSLPLSSTQSSTASSSTSNDRIPHGKGKATTLPDDFLRPPGYVPGMVNSISDDEALARMLQDELFTEELRRNPDFAHLAHGSNSNRRATSSDARFMSSSGRSTTQANAAPINPAAAAVNRLGEFARSFTSGGQQQQQQNRGTDNSVPASPNILEKISELGDNAKRRLQLLAAQFNANNNNNNNIVDGNDVGSARRAPEFRSLLDNDDDNMELAARKDL